VSIIFNVLERFALTKQCITQSLETTGLDDFEVLCCDQGSKDKRILPFLRELPNLTYLRENEKNEGNYQALNQLMLRAHGQYICVIDPDILLPQSWLDMLVATHQYLDKRDDIKPGVSGFHTTRGYDRKEFYGEVAILEKINGIFGTKFFSRRLLNDIGYFIEVSKYGFGDTNYGRRANRAGYTNYYIAGQRGRHIDTDAMKGGKYRRMKDKEMQKVGRGRREMWALYGREYIYLPAPEVKE
jgi:GT2 family glycosyltransferase